MAAENHYLMYICSAFGLTGEWTIQSCELNYSNKWNRMRYEWDSSGFFSDQIYHGNSREHKIFNTSLCFSVVPDQWKSSSITPVPKITSPLTCQDFRPISVTPVLSRLFEKEFVRQIIYPVLVHPNYTQQFSDQFAFRPTGSTTGALTQLLHTVTDMLQTEPYVHVIALDFSKAFDTVRHQTLLAKCSDLPIPDCTYNWLLEYFS